MENVRGHETGHGKCKGRRWQDINSCRRLSLVRRRTDLSLFPRDPFLFGVEVRASCSLVNPFKTFVTQSQCLEDCLECVFRLYSSRVSPHLSSVSEESEEEKDSVNETGRGQWDPKVSYYKFLVTRSHSFTLNLSHPGTKFRTETYWNPSSRTEKTRSFTCTSSVGWSCVFPKLLQ